MPERLLDHHTTPLTRLRLRQTMLGQLPADLLKRLRRDRQIKAMVTAGAAGLIQLIKDITEALKSVVVVELALNKTNTRSKLLPHRLIKLRSRMGLDVVLDLSRELRVIPLPTTETHQSKTRRQQPTVSEVINRRHQLLTGKITSDPEEHQRRRPGNTIQTTIPRIPQRIPKPGPW